jgi:hypothetical protein
MVPELLVLALDFHRAPLRYPHLTEPNHPLPKAFDTLLNAFATAVTPQNIDATAAALGRPPARIEEAARFFVRQVLLAPGADHYRVLGLSRSAGAPTVREHYHLLVRLFHPDRSGDEDELDTPLTARINDAYNTLRDPDARRRYDKDMAPFGAGDDAESDPAAFFRASGPIAGESPPAGTLPRRLRRLSALLLLALAAAGIAFPLLRMANAPALRANLDKNAGGAPGPSYLRQDAMPKPDTEPQTNRANGSPPPVIGEPPQLGGEELPAGVTTREQIRNAAVRRNAGPRQPVRPAEYAPAPPATPATPAATPIGTPTASKQKHDSPKHAPAPAKPNLGTPPERAAHPTAATPPPAPKPRAAQAARGSAPPARHQTAAEHPSGHPTTAVKPAPIRPPSAPAAPAGRPTPPAAQVKAAPPEPDRVPVPRSQALSSHHPKAPRAPPRSSDRRHVKQRLAGKGQARTGGKRGDKASNPKAPAAPKAPTRDPDRYDAAQRVDGLIRRFARSYETGDAGGFAALFTPNAQVNEGRGAAFIRSDYAAFFARVPERRLEVRHLSWRAAPDGKLAVRASVGLAVRDRGRSQWRRLAGVVDFEVVETHRGLRISKMIYSLRPP